MGTVIMRAKGENHLINPQLRDVISRTAHSQKSKVPNWDLGIVLKALTKAPFEPAGTCDLKYLTYKAVFPTAIASGARRSEIHALERTFQRGPNWDWILLKPIPEFVAKNQLIELGAATFRAFKIVALKTFLGPNMEDDALLCPVRCLRYYMYRTESLPTSCKLFVSLQKGRKDEIHQNTI